MDEKEKREALVKEQLKKVRRTLFRASFLADNAMTGDYASAFKGQGVEFSEVREYQPSDDVRAIDWKVTARTGKPFIKVFQESRELSVMLLVDVSLSMNFGSGRENRMDRAAAIAAFLAFSAAKNHDRIGLMLFSDKVEKYIPHKKGKHHIWNMVRELLVHKSEGKGSNLAAALEYLRRVVKKKTIVFVVSDFFVDNFEKPLRMAAAHHDIIAIRLGDSFEENIPNVGIVEMADPETGEMILLDTGNKKTATQIQENLLQLKEQIKTTFGKMKVDYIEIMNDTNVPRTFQLFFKRREKKFLKF